MRRSQGGAGLCKLGQRARIADKRLSRAECRNKAIFGVGAVRRKIRVLIEINIFFEVGRRRLGSSDIIGKLVGKIGFNNAVTP